MAFRFCIGLIILFTSITSSASNLENMIRELVIDKLGNHVVDIEMKFDSKVRFTEAESFGDEIKNVQLLHFAPNYSTFRVSVSSEKNDVIELSGRYVAYVEVPVTARGIIQGAMITDADISSARTPISKVKGGYVSSPEEVVGMQAKRNIGNGVFIKSSDLVKPTLIRQNDAVSIIYNNNNIKLRTIGIATESGAIGDSIKVKNETTGIVVHGVVKGKNLVEVAD